MTVRIAPPSIGKAERRARIDRLCEEMEKENLGAVLIGPTASLRYFTGVAWHASERFTGALIRADGVVEGVLRPNQDPDAGSLSVCRAAAAGGPCRHQERRLVGDRRSATAEQGRGEEESRFEKGLIALIRVAGLTVSVHEGRGGLAFASPDVRV